MSDIVDKKTRSRMMSGIRGKDTKLEIFLRKGLFASGLRFRLHVGGLPGKPDIVFPRFRALILAHGCFWHGHNCALFRWPSSNSEFWKSKIDRNRLLDLMTRESLDALGWRVLTVWECALKGPGRLPSGDVIRKAEAWIRRGQGHMEISGRRRSAS